jgi:hypothetical protein
MPALPTGLARREVRVIAWAVTGKISVVTTTAAAFHLKR